MSQVGVCSVKSLQSRYDGCAASGWAVDGGLNHVGIMVGMVLGLLSVV